MPRPRAHDLGARRLAMKILLAIDGSQPSITAVSIAKGLTLPAGSTIELLTVVADDPWTYGPWPIPAMALAPRDLERAQREVLSRLDGIATDLAANGRTIRTMVRQGRAASEIVREADRFGADLILLGARGHGAVDRILVGSVSSEVVDQAGCPVLVVRTPGLGRILVATDGSADGDLATRFLGPSGIFGTAAIKVLSVVDAGMPWWTGMSPVDGMVAADAYADVVDAAARHAKQVVRSTAETIGFDHVEAEAAPRGGDVGSTIVEKASAWHADVVAVGTRGHGAMHRALVGSTSRQVLHQAPMSVLVVRPKRAVVTPARTGAA
jgi:nucleotide-binding universal stress UspA family protein